MNKRDATAAVIGAGDFIGSAIAKRFADEGSPFLRSGATRTNSQHSFQTSNADAHAQLEVYKLREVEEEILPASA